MISIEIFQLMNCCAVPKKMRENETKTGVAMGFEELWLCEHLYS